MSIHHPKQRVREHLNNARDVELEVIGCDTSGKRVYTDNQYRTSHASERTDVLRRGRTHRIDDDTQAPEEHRQHDPLKTGMLGRNDGRLSRSIVPDVSPLGRIIAEIRQRKIEAALPEFGDVWVDEAPSNRGLALPNLPGSTGRVWGGDGHNNKARHGNAHTAEVSQFKQECKEILAEYYTPDNLPGLVDNLVAALCLALTQDRPLPVMREGAVKLNSQALKRLSKLDRPLRVRDVMEALGFGVCG